MSDLVQVHAAGGALDDTVARLVDEQVASRIAAQDPTLWGSPAQSEASRRLGWVAASAVSRPLVAEIEALRASLRAGGIDSVVLCGMGGSSLAPEVITATAGADLTVLDSTEPGAVRRALDRDLRRTVVVVSSKSGSTLETDSQRRAFLAAFEAAGIDGSRHTVVVTDPGSELHELGEAEGYRVFLADPSVGGRYSALTAFGLVPSGLAGVDVGSLLDEADAVREQLSADDPANSALVLAAGMAADPARNKVALVDAGSGLEGFPDWAEQLIAESTGKEGMGLLPVVVPPPGPSAPGPDVTVVELVAESDPEASGGNIRVFGSLGATFLLWETAVAVAGRLLGINPFDQPDVESAKHAARGLLDQRPEPSPPAFTSNAVEVRGSSGLLDGVDDLAGAVTALLGRLGERCYLAVMAYLDPQRDAPLAEAAGRLADRAGRPVTFGWGPRFLHSTGQYHKGGPPEGVFLQVTTDPTTDLGIPGRPFSFGELIAAQAAGDAQVLTDSGRPVLRLHLKEPEAGVRQLLEVLR